ncbi:MAG: hypothetical protein AAFN30_05395, partial [Actinomycetota bacterium]
MDESGSHSYDSGEDPAGQLAALEAEQRQLWATLREEDDPELRMSLLSRFSENRSAIGQLRADLGIDGPPANGGGPAYQVEIVSPTPSPRPGRPSRLDPVADQQPRAEDQTDGAEGGARCRPSLSGPTIARPPSTLP